MNRVDSTNQSVNPNPNQSTNRRIVSNINTNQNSNYYFILTPFVNHNYFFELGHRNLSGLEYGFVSAFNGKENDSNSLGAHFVFSYASLKDSNDSIFNITTMNLNMGANYKLDLIWAKVSLKVLLLKSLRFVAHYFNPDFFVSLAFSTLFFRTCVMLSPPNP